MAETRNQTLLESRSQLEEMRANQAQQSEQSLRQFEEQSKRDQDLRQELASLKSLLVELSMNQRPPGTPLNAFVPGSTSATPLHPDLQGSGTAQPRSSMFGQGVPPLPGGLSSRIAKVEFPKFDGSSIREWIYRYDQFFELDRTAPEMKVHLASLHMEDQKLTSQVHEIVGRINGRFGTLTAVPIHHLDRSLDFHALCALYAITDVALVSSLRDGMNLVSYEFVSCQAAKKGVLILSEFAGAAQSLGAGALLVNPWNITDCAAAIGKALNMSDEEREKQHHLNFSHVTTHTAQEWAETFVSELNVTVADAQLRITQIRPKLPFDETTDRFLACHNRLIILGFDLTLTEPVDSPGRRGGDQIKEMDLKLHPELREHLTALCNDPHTTIVVLSGSARSVLDENFGEFNIWLAAEHGMFLRHTGGEWMTTMPEYINTELLDSVRMWKPDELEVARRSEDVIPTAVQHKISSELPDGWIVEDVPRKHGLKSDRYFLEPLTGMKFQSVPEVLCGASGSSSTVSTSERNFPGIEFDWGEEGFLPRVRDQKDSCYCMLCAAAVVFEGLYFIENKKNIDFSEQFLIDHYKDSPSGVEHTDFINKYRDGICKTADYPLNIKDGSYERRKKKINIQGKEIFLMRREWNLFHYTVPDENRLMEQVRVQPVIAIIASSRGFSDHEGNDIYSTPNRGTLDHAVVITGYGKENGKKYWIGLASWGVGWGAKGYFRIKRGVGLCGLGSLFFAPCCRDALPRKEMKKKRKNKKRKVR